MAEPTEPSKTSQERSKSSGGLTDSLRRYVDAVVGVSEIPRERAERIVSDLAKRGEIRARDLAKAAQELSDRSARNRRELVGLVRKEIRRQIESMGLATRADVERVQRRLRELEMQTKRAPRKASQASKKTTRSSKSSER